MSATLTRDTRWSPGSTHVEPRGEVVAAYAARWLDYGTTVDILGDRQGFAGDEPERRKLMQVLGNVIEPHKWVPTDVRRDTDSPAYVRVFGVPGDYDACVAVRRVDGYVYFEAWLLVSQTFAGWRDTTDDEE